MTSTWAACIPLAEFRDLAALRLFADVEFVEVERTIWLRGARTDELERSLARVPGLHRFEVLETGQLRSANSRIPGGMLPLSGWRPLKEALVPDLPTAAIGGETRQKLTLSVVRSGAEQAPAALLTPLADWTEFAEHSPIVRLERLVFAVSEDRQVLVLGRPVPPLPGARMVNRAGILTPCGFAWTPSVEPAVLRQLFALGENDVAVLAEDGTHQVIRSEQFVRASRSAARATREGFDRHES